MRRNVEKHGAFCKRFSITTGNCEGAALGGHKKAASGGRPGRRVPAEWSKPARSYFQPLRAISCTAALFLAPICSADTLSDLNVPKRLRIGLLP
jgi:hypothetical protein